MTFQQRILRGWRVLLKHTLNPLTRRLAHSAFGPFSIVEHVGRRSGKHYETPIIVAPIEGGFVIELTYGPDVDWYQNVLAAGGCTILSHGKRYVIDKIEPIDTEIGRSAFPLPARVILHLLDRHHFVKLMTTADGYKK